MRWLVIISILVLVFVLSSCAPSQAECKKPFIDKDGECCLDLDDDSICDEEQGEKEAVQEPVVEETKPAEDAEKELPEKEITEELPEETISEEEIAEEETTEEEQEQEESEELAADEEEPKTKIEQFVATFAQKVDGYKYSSGSNWYFVRGDKIKIRLYSAALATQVTINNTYYPLFYYENIYLNKRDKTAVGYCEGTDPRIGRAQCTSLKIEDVPYRLSYSNYYKKLPEEWLFEYLGKTPIETGDNKYYMDGRRTTKLVFEEAQNKTVTLFFDEKTGLPVRVETAKDNLKEIFTYKDLSAGTIREEDVIHRSASEIPASEAFYSIYSK